MTRTVADFLLKLIDKEQELLKKYEIVQHPGIIGDMYEGLTKDILAKSIFQGINLNVRSGKIKNSKNEFSGEIDCMVVIGDGERIPHTEKYIYDSSMVIAVIQVKKNLFSKDIKDSYDNLRSVIKITEFRDGEKYHGRLLRTAWRLMFNEELPPRNNLKKLPIEKEMLYHILLMEAFYPTRIVWGYNGFKSEFSLRESFVKYLKENVSEEKRIPGYGPGSFPSLIICDKYSLVKTNGIPFAHPIGEDNIWPFYVSSYENPVYFLLEVIWTRLHFMFGITSEIFGDDMIVDEMHGFINCRYKEGNKGKGWEYFYINTDKNYLKKPFEHKEWEPVFLEKVQFVVITKLCEKGSINCNEDVELNEFLKENQCTLEALIISLKATGLVDTGNNVLSLITEHCVCGILPDGTCFAGDDKNRHVTKWLSKKMEREDNVQPESPA
ncbi:MAG: hypothetical protein K0Q79_1640 [Flavipsychrobacter sp.]|jgi:hypothetical protein|nr:hypothetical protein [Flavipsychrobacter sp.]